ncbi:hypothetical protein Z043_122370 [Scleropages formosus]|uniref:EGF-like domain-containing protein n=1 Tax=Scleropages formosus TaxID=113540 RepID=A0A0P7Y1Z3_SCLFO|nr:hypothetical protein Z043_122370 [Scleropages formosus]
MGQLSMSTEVRHAGRSPMPRCSGFAENLFKTASLVKQRRHVGFPEEGILGIWLESAAAPLAEKGDRAAGARLARAQVRFITAWKQTRRLARTPGATPSPDLNECGLKPRPCKHRCMNTYGSYKCYCLNGYMLLPDGSCGSESRPRRPGPVTLTTVPRLTAFANVRCRDCARRHRHVTGLIMGVTAHACAWLTGVE